MDNSKDILDQVIKNTGLSEKICAKYLEKNNFDMEKTFKEIQDKIKSGQIEVMQ